jgi:hypothetical protein
MTGITGPAWAPPPTHVVYQPSRGLATWAMLAAGLQAALGVVMTGTAWWMALTPRAPGFDWNSPSAPIAAADVADGVVSTLGLPVLVAAAVLGVVWTVRVRRNAERLAAAHHTRGRVWAWLGWLVPVVNLWFPYQVVSDVYRTADPDLPPQAPWGLRRVPGWFLVWWLTWLGFSALDSLYGGVWASSDPLDVDALRLAAVLQTLSAVVTVVAAVLWVRVVTVVGRDQGERARRLAECFPGAVLFR